MICPFCNREFGALTQHHVVPKELGGKETITICADCHSAIHARYTNKELKERLFTFKLLQADPDLRRAYKFLSKQASLKRFRNKQSNKRGKKGKYG